MKVKDWVLFVIRNAIVYILIVGCIVGCIYYFVDNDNINIINNIGVLNDIILFTSLIIGICFLFWCLLVSDFWFSKSVTKNSEAFKLIVYVLAIYVSIQPKYNIEHKLILLGTLLMIYLMLCVQSIKNLFWEDQFQFRIDEDFMEDSPVYESNDLTENQEKTFEQLNSLLNKASPKQSYVIALIGDWGCGKTSITSSLYTLHKDEYLFLLIDILALKKTNNIISYVDSYFKDYFYFYGIGYWGGNSDIKFFKSFLDFSTKNPFLNIWKGLDSIHFQDIHTQRLEFSKNIQLLLKKSKKNKIVFIIDDLDRIDNKQEIYPLLWEITDVPGIFSILNIQREEFIRIDGIDKYIQTRVFVEQKLYLTESSLNEKLISQFNRIKKEKGSNTYNFDFGEEEKAKKGYFPYIANKRLIDPKYKGLIDLFYEELINEKCDFETLFRDKISDYYGKILGLYSPDIIDQFNNRLLQYSQICYMNLNSYTELCLGLLDSNKRDSLLDLKYKNQLNKLFGNLIHWDNENGIIDDNRDFLLRVKNVLNHIVYSKVLLEFVRDLSLISLNNYRGFKYTLRESTSLNITYFENIIRLWWVKEKEVVKKILNENFKEYENKYNVGPENYSIDILIVNILLNSYSDNREGSIDA